MEGDSANKYFLILGAFLGFILTFIVSFVGGNEMTVVVRNATIGCIVAGILVRLLLTVFWSSVRSAAIKKMKEEESKMKEMEEINDKS